MRAEFMVEGRRFVGKDITGLRSGRLVAIRPSKIVRCGRLTKTHWLCRCDCGNEIEVFISNLKTQHTRSCGCLFPDAIEKAKVTHGGSRVGRWERLFVIWRSMMQRCYKKYCTAWKYYGARGILVDKRWHDYAAFRADMAASYFEGASLERIDNDGPYSPENTIWATRTQQARNRRSNLRLTMNGETLPLVAWCERFGANYHRVQGRLGLGWDLLKALTQPARACGRCRE